MTPKNKTATIPAPLAEQIQDLAQLTGISFSKMVALMLEERLPLEQFRLAFLKDSKTSKAGRKKVKVEPISSIDKELNYELQNIANRYGIGIDAGSDKIKPIQEPTIQECEDEDEDFDSEKLDLPW